LLRWKKPENGKHFPDTWEPLYNLEDENVQKLIKSFEGCSDSSDNESSSFIEDSSNSNKLNADDRKL